MFKNGNAQDDLVRKHEEKGLLLSFRSRWDDNIKIYVKRRDFYIVEQIHLPQERAQWRAFVSTVINPQIP